MGDRRALSTTSERHRQQTRWRTFVAAGFLIAILFVVWALTGSQDGSGAIEPAAPATAPAPLPRIAEVEEALRRPARQLHPPTWTSSAEEAVAAVVAHVEALIRDVLEERELRGLYSRDCDLAERRCLHQLSRALFKAVHNVVADAFRQGDLSLSWLLERHGAEVTERLLADIVATSSDPVVRSAALAVMEYADGLPLRELPPAAYDDLTQRPAAEVMLTLRRHEEIPVTREYVAAQLEHLVSDDSLHEHYRYAAAEALGHPETAERLNQVVGSLVAREQLTGDLPGRHRRSTVKDRPRTRARRRAGATTRSPFELCSGRW